MSIYYQDDYVTLYHGDSIGLSECTFHEEWAEADFLFTDPPYGIGWTGSSKFVRLKSGGFLQPNPGIQGDEDLTTRDTALDMWGAKKPALVFGSGKNIPPRNTKKIIAWVKQPGAGIQGNVNGIRGDLELIYLLGKWPPYQEGSPMSSSFINLGNYPQNRDIREAGGHPHAKNVTALTQLLKHAPSGVVADPFSGGGGILVAAKSLGRRAIGVEYEEKWCEVAAKRLQQEALPLFQDQPGNLNEQQALIEA